MPKRSDIPLPSRRRFLGLGVGSMLATGLPPERLFSSEETEHAASLYRRLVPADKGLPAAWVQALAQRDAELDAPIRASDPPSLAPIGMPVGGIACGTVYLSGDGRLYIWDIFNQHHEGVVANRAPRPAGFGTGAVLERDGANYLSPPTPDTHPGLFRQGFELVAEGQTRPMSAAGWKEVEFRGQWPVGHVRYADPKSPLEVELTAWTPFVPLELKDSSLPVTMMDFHVRNTSPREVQASLRGFCENPVFAQTRKTIPLPVRTDTVTIEGAVALRHRAEFPGQQAVSERADIRFADFEEAGYGSWTPEGAAFGHQPVSRDLVPGYQGDLGGEGERVVNSHASAPGRDLAEKDDAMGTLTSPEFTISRAWISLLLGGGNRPGETGVELWIDNQVFASRTGENANRMRRVWIDTSRVEGKKARLRLIDRAQGDWGNTGADDIIFTDIGPCLSPEDAALPDAGEMVFACLDPASRALGNTPLPEIFSTFVLAPGESRRVSFLIGWYFPNLYALPGVGRRKAEYSSRFAGAGALAEAVLPRVNELRDATFLWGETWYDSTLPQWLMARAVLTTCTLQTANCFLFEDGRFWAWEGVGACPGTCTHVWHYAQGVAALFPEIERNLREVTDFGISLQADGGVRYRAEADGLIPIDGQAGVVLRTLREHRKSPDARFLRRVWPGVRMALEWLIRFDENDSGGSDGLLEGRQHNTLDADWFGKVPCLCTLYLAALRAGEEMAREVGEDNFAQRCREIFSKGQGAIEALFNGRSYIQQEDPAHATALGVGKGVHIDQVIGQWWAHLNDLDRLVDRDHVHSALHALWEHNFVPNVGRFRQVFRAGRFYAWGDEAGLVMCSWPDGGLRAGMQSHWQFMYFNECMSGFEYQAGSHMIQEGGVVDTRAGDLAAAIEEESDPRSLTLRGLAVARAVHDRYAASKRNPYNEIECSDHYARAGASYALYLAASDFRYHGPRAEFGFAPKVDPQHFRAPFVAATAWGQYRQDLQEGAFTAEIEVRRGTLKWKTFLARPGREISAVFIDALPTPATLAPRAEGMLAVTLHQARVISAGQTLHIRLV